MKEIPIYFPMTYLPPAGLLVLSACFGQVAVCRPSNRELPETMQAAVDQGSLVVFTPVDAENDRLNELMDAYYAWARENNGVDLAFYKGRDVHIPFFEDTSVSNIRQSIRDMDPGAAGEAAADPVFEARLFLEMAQALDSQNKELEQSLEQVRDKEKNMLGDLLGDSESHPDIGKVPPFIPAGDPGAYLTARRLQAWGRLFQAGSVPGRILVTDSQVVMEHLVERQPALERLEETIVLPLPRSGDETTDDDWQGRLRDYLLQVIERPEADRLPELPVAEQGAPALRITLFRCARTDAGALFGHQTEPPDTGAVPDSGRNLLICYVAIEDESS